MTNETLDNSNGGRKYFGTVPHMAGAKLDVYEHRLYSHYIEICGISRTDECYQSEKTIRTACKMSKQRFIKSRDGLVTKGFITFRAGMPNSKGVKGYSALTTIIDIWAENIEFCKTRSYRGKILPVEGVNNYPLKGSDITPNKNSNNIKEEKDIPQPESAVDGDGSDLDDKKMSNGWYKYTYDAILGEYHCTCCKELIGNIRNTGGVYYSPNEISLTHYCHDCFIARDGGGSALDDGKCAVCQQPMEILDRCRQIASNIFVHVQCGFWLDTLKRATIKWTDSVHADTLGDYIDGEIVDCEADGCDGKCEIDDVNDNTQCDTCKTEYTVQRDCSIADGGTGDKCDSCEFKDGCKMINDGVYLHKRNDLDEAIVGGCGDHHRKGECPDYDSKSSCGDCKCGKTADVLTDEQAAVLEMFVDVEICFDHSPECVPLSNMGYLKTRYSKRNGNVYHITDTGCKALEAWRAAQKNDSATKHSKRANDNDGHPIVEDAVMSTLKNMIADKHNLSISFVVWNELIKRGWAVEYFDDGDLSIKSTDTGRAALEAWKAAQQPLTDEQAAVLEWIIGREDSASLSTIYKYTKADDGEVGRLKLSGYIEQDTKIGSLCYSITDTGRAALGAWKAQRAKDNTFVCKDCTVVSHVKDVYHYPEFRLCGDCIDNHPEYDAPGKIKQDCSVPERSNVAPSQQVEKPKAKKVRKPKKKAHPLYKEMSDAIIDAFDHDREKMLGKDFNRIGGVAKDLLARGAKPFMIGRLYDWIDKKFNTEFGYNTLDKWYLNWRSEMGDRIPDELPTKQAEEPTVSSAMIGEVTLEDCQRATRELAAKMSMSNYEDNDNGS